MDLKIELGKEDDLVTLRLHEMSDDLIDFINKKSGFQASNGFRFEVGGLTMFKGDDIITLSAVDKSQDIRVRLDRKDRDAFFNRIQDAFTELRTAFQNQSVTIEF